MIISTLIFGSIAASLALLVNPRIASFIGGVIWARFLGLITPMLVRVTGRENINKKQSYVIISNHQSHYDVLVLYGWLGIDFKWVMKQELRKIPGLGIGCEKIGHIFIDRSNRERSLASINAAKEKIVDGTSVIFFPEGTRGETGELGEFKKGAFKLALEMKLPILPITIKGTSQILPPRTFNLKPGIVSMVIHPAIDVQDHNEDTLPDLMMTAHQIIASAL
ncbi:lysophospholipid acyltransferase family protein [candidate division CSSED10-310 bacterium]|uniref:1-acyl-sn-glycerol-3-phosphate acyltransferase n=1 Tax=candidate division CSSED10-310 bacterium TaxID=2855610 RepID=A0ABV6YVG4_UNCC1